MKKILLKSLIALALIVTFSAEVDASEVTGNLSSSTTQGSNSEVGGTLGNGTISGNVGSGSEVSGTLSNGTISGNVSSSSTSGGGSSGSSRGNNNTGIVLGAATTNTPGQVLAAADTPGFPATGLGPEATLGSMNLLGLIVAFAVLLMYAYHRSRINA